MMGWIGVLTHVPDWQRSSVLASVSAHGVLSALKVKPQLAVPWLVAAHVGSWHWLSALSVGVGQAVTAHGSTPAQVPEVHWSFTVELSLSSQVAPSLCRV